MPEFSIVQKIAIWVLPVLCAIILHEVAHGWVAEKLGDPTARMLGRLTLNPIKHIDPVGTILMPAVLLLLTRGSFMFGYAKPVPIGVRNFKNMRRDMAIVGAAGPAANLCMAFTWCLAVRAGPLLQGVTPNLALPVMLIGVAGIYINVMLMILNLIPIPPLDGGRVLSGLLPKRWALTYDRLEPWGFLIVGLLLITRVLAPIIVFPLSIIIYYLAHLAGLSFDGFQMLLSVLT
ncbi:MAG TPA: site-2 protease family protein [Gammaproteobacteria bacterium]|jgi:Zn-dependent protease